MTLPMLAQTVAPAAAGPNEMYLYWGFILFAIAVILVVVELFVPSGGLIGVLAGVCTVGSVVAFFMYDTGWGIGVAFAYLLLGPIAAVFGFRLWAASPLSRRMVLGGDTGFSDSESAGGPEDDRRQQVTALRALVGAEGETETALRPVGTVRINGQRIDAMAESGVIPAGTPVVVTDVYDNQIKVRPR